MDLGTLLKKDPHPPKEKSVFLINLEDSFLDIWEFGEIIYGKIGGGFYLEILYGFCGEWIDIVGEFFGIFFWIRGVLKFWAKNLAAIRSHNYAPPFGCGRAGVMEGGLT